MYRYKRLPFGVKPAASIFQSAMDEILKGIANVQCYIDDILCWGPSRERLQENVLLVLDRLLQFNVKVNGEKCHWFVTQVKYLGHILSKDGVSANPKGIAAIVNAPEPTNVSKVRSFIGMAMFYSKFIPNLNQKLAPLYHLLKKDTKFVWSAECKRAFENFKKEITSTKMLAHYDPKKPIVITTDASDEGIGACLKHQINGEEFPVFFISQTLTKAEQKKGESPIIATRLQRYVIRMSIFNHTLAYRKRKDNGHADGLVRLPLEAKPNVSDELKGETLDIRNIISDDPLSLNVDWIKRETEKDELLRKVLHYVRNGWPQHGLEAKLKSLFKKNEAFSIKRGCLLIKAEYSFRLLQEKIL